MWLSATASSSSPPGSRVRTAPPTAPTGCSTQPVCPTAWHSPATAGSAMPGRADGPRPISMIGQPSEINQTCERSPPARSTDGNLSQAPKAQASGACGDRSQAVRLSATRQSTGRPATRGAPSSVLPLPVGSAAKRWRANAPPTRKYVLLSSPDDDLTASAPAGVASLTAAAAGAA